MEHLQRWFKILQQYANRWWYAPLIGFLAAADLFLVVIPTDGLVVSAAMLSPKRWLYIAVVVSIGSSIGCLLLADVIQVHGLPILLQISPGIDQSSIWKWTQDLMNNWGEWALFVIAVSPVMQHPAVAIAALAGMSLSKIFFVVLAGRAVKYLFLAWLATHAPAYLSRVWGMQYELKEVGLDDPSHKKP